MEIIIGVLRGLSERLCYENCAQQDQSCNQCLLSVSYDYSYCCWHGRFPRLAGPWQVLKSTLSGQLQREKVIAHILATEGGKGGWGSRPWAEAGYQGPGSYKQEMDLLHLSTVHPAAILPSFLRILSYDYISQPSLQPGVIRGTEKLWGFEENASQEGKKQS
jgi:hypothetical protein